jgi:signal transduction histidine kinase
MVFVRVKFLTVFVALFRKVDDGANQVDINEIILATLQSFREEFLDHKIETRSKLTSGLPPVEGHKGQLQEVISNLIHNAVDAMDATINRSRILRVTTDVHGDDAIKLTVEDSGPGIDANKIRRNFWSVHHNKVPRNGTRTSHMPYDHRET